MAQNIKWIKISKLKLWTENPRDPVDTDGSFNDLKIIKRAMEQKQNKWNLKTIAKQMGRHYDFSELPTVVEEGNSYSVYDGNRRLAILKYIQNPEWQNEIREKIAIEYFDNFKKLTEIPCNVCDKQTALVNIERKHINNSSWGTLERDYFQYKHMEKPSSVFLTIENETGIISSNKKMNQRFVKEEILTNKNLNKIGFHIENKKIFSSYNKILSENILNKIVELIESKKITTREERGRLPEILQKEYSDLKLIKYNENKKNNSIEFFKDKKLKATSRSRKQTKPIFGGTLQLHEGKTNDIYKDIVDLYQYFLKNQNKLSSTFPNLIRMILRMLVESVSKKPEKIDYYIKRNFENAKKMLTVDEKTTLSSKVQTSKKLIQLLQIGAHDYSISSNIDDTLVMSLIIGKMLTLTHSKNNK